MFRVWIADLDNNMDMKSTTHSVWVIGSIFSQNSSLKGQYVHVLISMLVVFYKKKHGNWFMVELAKIEDVLYTFVQNEKAANCVI